MSREILFYSDFPFGYHNPEAEERMRRFAARGYEVHYVEQLGIRNPKPQHLLRVLSRIAFSPEPPGRAFNVVSPKLLPPRRAPGIRALNRRWLARQLLAPLRRPDKAIFWIRYPTPELLHVVEAAAPALLIYELVDDHEGSPGLPPRLRRLIAEAERQLIAKAGLVLASSEPVRARLARLHPNVRRLPAAAVDLNAFAAPPPVSDAAPVAIYAGHADFRFDADLVAEVAGLLDEWRFVIAGPAAPPVRRRLAGIPNVVLTGHHPPEAIPGLLAEARVCLLPYKRGEFSNTLFPVKLVEYLAAGRPVVGVPIAVMDEFAEVVSTAAEPGEFASAIVEAAARDSAAAQSRRQERARPFAWDRRIAEMEAAIDEVLADG